MALTMVDLPAPLGPWLEQSVRQPTANCDRGRRRGKRTDDDHVEMRARVELGEVVGEEPSHRYTDDTSGKEAEEEAGKRVGVLSQGVYAPTS
jgi:hypothetical protein